MNLKQRIFTIYTVCFLLMGNFSFAQIKVLESSHSDSTMYANTTSQDSIFIVYKEGNNRNSISLYADLNGIDALNYEWYKYNVSKKDFIFLEKADSVKSNTIIFDDPELNMDTIAGGYRVRIFSEKKAVDTTFTVWVWYQDFYLNTIKVESSTCSQIGLSVDYIFDKTFTYYDLSTLTNEELSLSNNVVFEWTLEPGKESDKKFGDEPFFSAPVEPTTYKLKANDEYLYTREATFYLDETELNSRGLPYLIATKPYFSAIHGVDEGENKAVKADSAQIRVEAPHGVWFNNLSQNGELFEWVFFNHKDWPNAIDDSLSNLFEPGDSIYYKRPRRDINSPEGYDVQLTSWGPVYNDYGDRCKDSIHIPEFVLVDTTSFPKEFKQLPNVFSPNGKFKTFYFVDKPESDDKPVQSISYFSIKIYNRWGNKVYEYEDNDGSWHEDGKDSPGWDGTTRVGTQAKPGVYYYAIVAEGWDGRDFKVAGYVHLF